MPFAAAISSDWNFRFAAWIVLATLPIAVAGVLLAPVLNACGSPLRSLTVIGMSCVVMAVLLALAEIYCAAEADHGPCDADGRDDRRRRADRRAHSRRFAIGLDADRGSVLAISGARRQRAFRFCSALPAIAAAGLKEIWELHKAHLDAHGWSILVFGLVIASISAFARDLGLVAHPRALFGLALRRLSRADRHLLSRLPFTCRLAAELTDVNHPGASIASGRTSASNSLGADEPRGQRLFPQGRSIQMRGLGDRAAAS